MLALSTEVIWLHVYRRELFFEHTVVVTEIKKVETVNFVRGDAKKTDKLKKYPKGAEFFFWIIVQESFT